MFKKYIPGLSLSISHSYDCYLFDKAFPPVYFAILLGILLNHFGNSSEISSWFGFFG